MVNSIIKEIFDESSIQYKETKFNKPPQGTYAIFTDNVQRNGADLRNFTKEHHTFIELYSHNVDEESEIKLETAIDNQNLKYYKSERVYLDDLSLYQVIYDFEYITK